MQSLKLIQRWPPLVSLAVLILNDHYLKAHYGNWWTGKLSDFAGCFFLPIFLTTLMGLFAPRHLRMIALGSSIFTVVFFITLKMDPRLMLFIRQFYTPFGSEFKIASDATDLIALPMAALAYFWMRKKT